MAAEVKKHFPEKESFSPPAGYNSLENIRGAMFHWLPVPFAGISIWCKCRTLNRTQIESCGDLSLLNINEIKDKEVSREDLIELRNTQENLIKSTLVTPSYDDFLSIVLDEDEVIKKRKNDLEEIKKLSESDELTSEQKKEIDDEIYRLELFIAYLLPEDTFGFLTSWALGIDISDIQKITKEQLLNAAILAKNGNDNPTDHLSGVFTDRDKEEINIKAWSEFNNYQKLKNLETKGNFKWIGKVKRKRK